MNSSQTIKNILIDFGHPFHFHVYKPIIKSDVFQNFDFLVIARNKDITHKLLNSNSIKFTNRGKGQISLFGKFIYLIGTSFLVFRICIQTRPFLLTGFASPYLGLVSRIMGIPYIVLDDTDNDRRTWIFHAIFAKHIITPTSFPLKKPNKQIQFSGCFEQVYLHPYYFKPDVKIKEMLNLQTDEHFIIARFVSHHAVHDINSLQIDLSLKHTLVNTLKQFGKIFISSEDVPEKEFLPYVFPLEPHMMHHAMSFASLVIGESTTMASEAAVLGVPAIFFDPVGRCYTREEEEKYGLVFRFDPTPEGVEKGLQKAFELLNDSKTKEIWQAKRKAFLDDSINVQAFLIWFIENYPDSATIMKENPDYQYNFR